MSNLVSPSGSSPFLVPLNFSWQDSPHEVLVSLFSKCSVVDLGQIARTCKTWSLVSQDEQLWSHLLKRYFPYFETSTMTSKAIKEKCIQIVRKCRNLPCLIYSVPKLPHDDSTHNIPKNSNFKWHDAEPRIIPTCTLKDETNDTLTAFIDYDAIVLESSTTGNVVTIDVYEPLSCIHAQNATVFFGASKDIKAYDFYRIKSDDNNISPALFSGHTDTVTCLKTWRDNLISGSSDTTIRIWEIASNKCIDTLTDHVAGISVLLVAGDLLFSGDKAGTLKVRDLKLQKCIQTIHLFPTMINLFSTQRSIPNLAFDPPFLYVQKGNHSIQVFLLQDRKLEPLIDLPASVYGMAIKEGRLALAGLNGTDPAEIELDFGDAATLKTTLEYISKCYRDHLIHDRSSSILKLFKLFHQLDGTVKAGIYHCMSKLVQKDKNFSLNLSSEESYWALHDDDDNNHDKMDAVRADAIDMWIKENLKSKKI